MEIKELLSRKEPDPEHLKNSQSINIAKKEKMSSGGNTRSVAGHFIKSLPVDLISHLSWGQEWDYNNRKTASWN